MSLSQFVSDVHVLACDEETFRWCCVVGDWPAFLAGVTDAWFARRWTVAFLAARLGDRVVASVVLRDGRFELDSAVGVRVAPMRLAEYFARLAAFGASSYYLRLPLDGDLAALAAEVGVACYGARVVVSKTSLWIGVVGMASDIHYDMTYNVVAQIVGCRRVTLFASEEALRLYSHPLRSLNWYHSCVRLDASDFVAHSRFREVWRATVPFGSGELLFISKGWWHHFESLEIFVVVNRFWVILRQVPAIVFACAAWTLAVIRT